MGLGFSMILCKHASSTVTEEMGQAYCAGFFLRQWMRQFGGWWWLLVRPGGLSLPSLLLKPSPNPNWICP